jgi:hypothetical protein
MKAEIISKTELKEFRPFEIVITVENIGEARLLYHICNHSRIGKLILADKSYNRDWVGYNSDIAKNMGDIWAIIKEEIINQKFEL